ncbi:uncharacterized protein LOC106662658 [Cimex lectularius]|uniref:Uncharacterized protein n=1 Tax=Cimex lectularius TaxID=79782 RepID=A0A8I6RAL6_CIMLE|nr:uncharacterized protein LOC106662658 [Cimex lectularius]
MRLTKMAKAADTLQFSLVLLGLLLIVFKTCNAYCHLNVTLLKSRDSPMVIQKENGHLKAVMPSFIQDNYVFINLTGQDINLACPGKENRFDFIKNNPANFKCGTAENRTVFYIDGQDFDHSLVTCFDYLIAYENELNQTCHDGKGELFEIGFQIDSQQFYRMYTICYNIESGFSYYAKHSIEGFPDYPSHHHHLLKQFSVMNPRMAKKLIHVLTFMRRKRQYDRLSNILGLKISEKYFRGQNHFFTGVTLVPHADFLVTSHQTATHIKANLLFLWKPREVLWRTLEYNIRLLARNKTINIITGVLDRAKINNNTLYMGPQNSLPIHSYLWKFVADPKTNKCILFLMENFVIDDNVKHKCNLPCTQNGWLKHYKWKKSDYRVFFCCDISEMKETISDIPSNSKCTSILTLE